MSTHHYCEACSQEHTPCCEKCPCRAGGLGGPGPAPTPKQWRWCRCQGVDPISHVHYEDSPNRCARCRCDGFVGWPRAGYDTLPVATPVPEHAPPDAICAHDFNSTICVAPAGHAGAHVTSNERFPHGLAIILSLGAPGEPSLPPPGNYDSTAVARAALAGIELAERASLSPELPPAESEWFFCIEWPQLREGDSAAWWDGTVTQSHPTRIREAFTTIIRQAVRFSDRRSAETVLGLLKDVGLAPVGLIVTEHGWMVTPALPVSCEPPSEPSEAAIDAAEKVARAPNELRSWREEMRLRLRAAYRVDRGVTPRAPDALVMARNLLQRFNLPEGEGQKLAAITLDALNAALDRGITPPNFVQMCEDFLAQETLITTEHKNGFAHVEATGASRHYLNAFVGFLTRRFSGYGGPVSGTAPPEPSLTTHVVIEALKQADRALNNLIDEDGHAMARPLTRHPEPCRRLDFCVMNDSRQVQGRIRNAVRILERVDRGAPPPEPGPWNCDDKGEEYNATRYRVHRPGAGYYFRTEAEARAVCDALNRVAGRVVKDLSSLAKDFFAAWQNPPPNSVHAVTEFIGYVRAGGIGEAGANMATVTNTAKITPPDSINCEKCGRECAPVNDSDMPTRVCEDCGRGAGAPQ